ncbi:MAG: Cna B-type domain-containing protein [Ruminococcaceae bacterium]|nr:Cna B-type domain-containing protein [Oscillospiraceae bacterium]
MKQIKACRLPMLLAGCFLLLCTAALAAQTASLRVTVKNESGRPVQDIRVELLQVAAASGSNIRLMPTFAQLGISAEALLADSGADHAEAVYQYVNGQSMSGQVMLTDSTGIVDVTGLQAGIYLVFERGGQDVAFPPCLIVLRPGESVTSTPKTSETDTGSILVMKWWEDAMDAAGKRPASVRVALLRNGVPFRRVTLSAANNWQHRFHSLPANDVYTVQEEPVAGYRAEYVSEKEVWKIINTYQPPTPPPGPGGPDEPEEPDEPDNPPDTPKPPEYVHVVVQKKWDDNNDAAGKRPASISVQLIRDGEVLKTAVLSAANDWRYRFVNLEKSGSYTVRELPVTDYTAVYQGNASTGIVVINHYTGTTDPGTSPDPTVPEKKTVDIPMRVVWVDNNNAAGKRPETVTVRLLADGNVVGTLELGFPQEWEGVFHDVFADMYYSVWQNAVPEYSTVYSGSAEAGFVITNTYTSGTADPGTPPDPSQPDVPDDPVTPPKEPDDPVTPPEEPDTPKIPQTGAEMGSVYLLLALGGLLTLLGLVDLYRGRRES